MYIHTVLSWCDLITKKVMDVFHPSNTEQLHNQTMADKSTVITYVSALFTSWWGFVTSQEGGIFAGILLGGLSLLVSIFFKMREDSRAREMHEIEKALKLSAQVEQEQNQE